jgi:hypothetical protein
MKHDQKKIFHIMTAAIFVAFIGMLIIPVATLGVTIPKNNDQFMISSTGKLISIQKNNLPSQYSNSNIVSTTQNYNENATACGACDANWAALLNIPIQPHFKPVTTGFHFKIFPNGTIIF